MSRSIVSGIGAVAVFAIIVGSAAPAWAVIERLTPLQTIIEDSDAIVVARVTKVDADKSVAHFEVKQSLSGDAPFKELAVSLKGDTPGETPQLVARLAADLPVVLFVTEVGGKQLVLGYSNGTWFQILGQKNGGTIRWSFTHLEPFLRRTYKSPTADLEKLLTDIVAGKTKPPAVNAEEKPGLGPAIEKKP